MKASPTIDSLTGFRFLAAMMVFLSHYDIPGLGAAALRTTRSGYSGVTLFFVLSGFVISYNYLERFEGVTRAGLLRDYFVARFARVYPLYLCFIAFGYLAQGMTELPWMHIFALQAWSPDLSLAYAVNSPSWSIGVEAFLYLAFPLLVPLLARFGVTSSLRRVQLAGGVVLAAMFGAALYFTYSSHGGLPIDDPGSAHRWLYRMPAARLGDFLLGMLGAVWFMRFSSDNSVAIRRWGYASTGALVAMVLLLAARKNFQSAFSWDLAYALPAIVLILGLAMNRRSVLSRLLGSPTWVLLGEASYAFYLVHVPVSTLHHGTVRGLPYELALYVIFLAMVIALSIGLHISIERPARRWLRAWLSSRATATIPAPLQPASPAGGGLRQLPVARRE